MLPTNINNNNNTSFPRVVIVRHGERADKYPDLKPLQEPNNPSMTQTGFVQAIGIGKLLKSQSLSAAAASGGGGRKWRILSSPFLRTLQTASAIMSVLGKELIMCENHSSSLEVDFEIGEHFKWPELPAGIVNLTPESASQIVKESFERSSDILKNDTSSVDDKANKDLVVPPPPSPPIVNFGYGSAKEIRTKEPLADSGARMYRAIQRLYHGHLMKTMMMNANSNSGASGSSTFEQLPNLLLVSHGYAPSQLARVIYGADQIEATRIFLCSTTCLRPISFPTLSTTKQDEQAVKQENANDEFHFEFEWTRGVDYLTTSVKNDRKSTASSDELDQNGTPIEPTKPDDVEAWSPEMRKGEQDVPNTPTPTTTPRPSYSYDESEGNLNTPSRDSTTPLHLLPGGKEDNGIDHTWYESRINNKKEEEYFLGFPPEPKVFPSSVTPTVLLMKNSTDQQ